MQDIITVEDKYYILLGSSQGEKQTRVLKHGETFAIFDRQGSIRPIGSGEQGVFHDGTRFLSRFQLRLAGKAPLCLGSVVKEDNDVLVVDAANPDLETGGRSIKGDLIHVFQTCFLWQGNLYLRVRLENYSLEPLELPISMEFGADFRDIFEVRGKRRADRGRALSPQVGRDSVLIGYLGLDGVDRTARLRFGPVPDSLGPERADWNVRLEPHGHAECFFTLACETCLEMEKPLRYEQAYAKLSGAYRAMQASLPRIDSSHPQFNSWLNRSSVDLFMMITETPHGIYPYAGIPWFSTVFGRDGILTAMQLLWINPSLAAGVLRHLAARQAKEIDPAADAEPGKILHEARGGEMANLREIPFGLYYGSVDSTPLFLMLADRYQARTGDLDLIRTLWPNLEAALGWVDVYGDVDGDGFVEYQRREVTGLIQQGWKDSEDSVFHADGGLASHPIALCEVQGYVFAAKRGMARLARLLGRRGLAARLEGEADELRSRFRKAFWMADKGMYALALDGEKRPCRVRSSNAGHCLFTGIALPEDAPALVAALMDPDMHTGWGIRTLAQGEARYNPMSYHNGSIWPHDNAVIAWGMGRYGFRAEAAKVLEGLFQASLAVDLHRLPELFCGFIQRGGEGPTLYPVACNPQAWASASVFFLLEACLGLEIDAAGERVKLDAPVLPHFLDELRIRDLRVGDSSLDLTVRRHEGGEVSVEVPRRTGRVEVVETLGAHA